MDCALFAVGCGQVFGVDLILDDELVEVDGQALDVERLGCVASIGTDLSGA